MAKKNNSNKGLSGNNTLIGGSGNDKINGGASSDILDGRAGSDSLNGDSGNDILIYGLAENGAATDVYTGGSGIDTVRIDLTQAEWLSAEVEYQLARYYQHLQTVKTNKKTGEVSNGSTSDFTFDFGNGSTLTVQMMESLEITVDGVTITNQDQPVIKSAPQAADVVEDGDSDDSESTSQSASGSIDFFDLDLSDNHSVSVVTPAGAYGALTANVSDPTLGDSQGTVAWSYLLDNAAVQFLAAGEQRTEVFTIRIADTNDSANFAETQVTVTITGTNDAPVIGVADQAGAVTEIADNAAGENTDGLISTGTMAFTDVDLNDTHTITVTAAGTDYRGALSAAVTSPSAGGAGLVTWDFKVNDSALDNLAAGQSLTQVYTVEIDDGNGGKDSRDVTITITGTNDVPVIGVADQAGAVTEIADNAAGENTDDLTSTGTMAFTDVDLNDTHTITVTAAAADYRGALSAAVTSPSAGGAGLVTWDFKVNDSALDNLAAGQSLTQVYTVEIEDGEGGKDSRDITITITGTNDAPVITGEDLAGSVTELEAPAGNLTDSGTISFSDVDLTDEHLVSATGTPVGATLGSLSAVKDSDTTNSGTGGQLTWTYSVAAGAVEYLAANQTITESFTISIDDQNGGVISKQIDVTITGTNDAPIITAEDLEGSVTELETPTGNLTDSGTISFSDVDLNDVHLVSATGTPVGTTLGSLSAVKDIDTTGTGSGGQLTWTYSVAAGAVEYLAVGQTITESFTISIDDQNGGVISKQIDVAITGTNDAPTVAAVTLTAQEDGAAIFGSFNGDDVDTDDDSTSLVYDIIGSPTSGLLTNNGDGTFAFDPDGKFETLPLGEPATFTLAYTATDQHDAVSLPADLTITVNGANDAPTLAAGTMSAVEDGPAVTLNLATLGNDIDSDDDGTSLTYAVADSLGGTASIAGTTLSFDPGSDFQYLGVGKSTSFDLQVTATDEHGAVANNTVTVTVDGVNDDPDAADDTGSLTVLAAPAPSTNVYWVDWTNASIESTAFGRNPVYNVEGTITLPNKTIDVTYHGQLTGYQLSGGTDYYVTKNGGYFGPVSSTEGVGVYTSPEVGNGPTNNDILRLYHADSARTLTFSEPVDNLFFAIVSMNANGYLLDQDFRIVSSADSASDSGFWGYTNSYTKTDLGDGRFGIATPTVTPNEFHGVLAIDNAVQSLTWTSQSDEDWNGFTIGTYGAASTATASGNVLGNDTDVDVGDTLTVVAANGQTIVGNSVTFALASGATVNVNKDGSYLYDENGAFTHLGQDQQADDSFTYTISDGNGGTDTATVTIQVTGINDAPVANPDSASVDEDSSVTISVLANDTDVDNGDTKSIQSVTNGQNGTVTISGSDVVYTPAPNFYGNDSFSYVMQDALGLTSTASVNVIVNPVNDGPVINFQKTTIANGSFESGLTDWSSSEINFIGDWQAADGTKLLDMNAEAGGGYVEQSLQTIVGAQYTVGFALSKNPGTPATGGLETLRVSAAGSTQDYVFSQSNSELDMQWSQQTFTFTANSTSTTLRLASADATGGSDAWGPALDNVRLLADLSAYEDTATTINGLSVSDVDAGSNPITVGLSVSEGTLTISGSGLSGDLNGNDGTLSIIGSQADINAALANGLVYKGNQDYFGADTLSVTVNDQGNFGAGGNLSTAKNISINVVPVNDGPSISFVTPSLANGSFEQVLNSTNDWSVYKGNIDRVGNSTWNPGDGDFSLDMHGFEPGGIQQTLATFEDMTYVVEFQLGKNHDGVGTTGTITTATLRASAGSTYDDYIFNDATTQGNIPWSDEAFVFTATGNSTVLSFESQFPTTGAKGPALDNVRIYVGAVADEASTIKGLSVADIDSGTSPVLLSLSVNGGTLDFSNIGSLTAVDGDGSDGTISYTGSLADINAALLAGIVYTPDSGFGTFDTLTATIDDQGATGAPGSLTATQDVEIVIVGAAVFES